MNDIVSKRKFVTMMLLMAVLLTNDIVASIRPIGKEGKRPLFEVELDVKSSDLDRSHRFSGLDYGLRLEVVSDVSADEIVRLKERSPNKMEKAPIYLLSVEPAEFIKENLSRYIRDMGIIMFADQSTDRILRVTVERFDVGEMTADAKTSLRYELLDENGVQLIPPQTVSGTDHSKLVTKNDKILAKSCARAMSAIDWNAIAFQLGIRKKTNASVAQSKPENVYYEEPRHPNESPVQKVTGDGDTALEHTIIRWYIISSPQGADVTWRVVSSTPDVKNTNGNYVGNTPYESTESFDIKGLTYNNSGNVQIEVMCEKPGYLPQKKRFNLRQAIDQKEISAKFNLVKDE